MGPLNTTRGHTSRGLGVAALLLTVAPAGCIGQDAPAAGPAPSPAEVPEPEDLRVVGTLKGFFAVQGSGSR